MIFSMKIAYKLGVQSGAIILYIYIYSRSLSCKFFFLFFFPRYTTHDASLFSHNYKTRTPF